MFIAATITPELNPIFSILFLLALLIFVVAEIVGIVRPEAGDTFTEHWRWLNQALKDKGMAGQWLAWGFRIFTGGLLVWTLLHFLAGSE